MKPEKPKVVREAVRAYPAVDADGFDAKAFFTPERIAEIEAASEGIRVRGGVSLEEVERRLDETRAEWLRRNGG